MGDRDDPFERLEQSTDAFRGRLSRSDGPGGGDEGKRMLEGASRTVIGSSQPIGPTGTAPAAAVPPYPPLQTLIDLSANPDQAEMLTVALFLEFTPPPNDSNPERGRIRYVSSLDALDAGVAVIQWGTGGVQQEAEVDFLDGMTFALCASYLRVSAGREYLTNAVGSEMTLGASAGYGAVAGANIRPQRTRYVNVAIATMSIRTVPVPPYARSFKVMWQGGDGAGIDMTVNDPSNSIIYEGRQAQFVAPPEWPVPNDARSVTIQNLGAVDIIPLRVVFELDL